MFLFFKLQDKTYRFDARKPLDISIPLDFYGQQPNIYGVSPARSQAFEGEGFIGDTRRGGSCNFEVITLNPHCNGTHTECIGHLTNERVSVQKSLKDVFIPATLISLTPENALSSNETYTPEKSPEDWLLTRKELEIALQNASQDWLQALIVRTLPNEETKKERQYLQEPPPFFSLEAMQFIAENNVRHLLTDVPSLDRTFDEGKLSTHHIFWNIKQNTFDIDETSRIFNTVTEMIFVDSQIPDGSYLLNLQIAPFVSDASPSRPLLFEVFETEQENS